MNSSGEIQVININLSPKSVKGPCRRPGMDSKKSELRPCLSLLAVLRFDILRFKTFYACLQTQKLQLIENLKLMTFSTLGGRSNFM